MMRVLVQLQNIFNHLDRSPKFSSMFWAKMLSSKEWTLWKEAKISIIPRKEEFILVAF